MLYLLDSSALINSPSFEFKPAESYLLTGEILAELKEMKIRHLAENALFQGVLKISEPAQKTIEKVAGKISSKGFNKVSKADISLIALAFELKESKKKFEVITDDYSIQNFLKMFKIPYESVSQKGIKKTISFSVKCRGCGKKFKPETRLKKCDDCGSGLGRTRIE